jgi:hypothetical protein
MQILCSYKIRLPVFTAKLLGKVRGVVVRNMNGACPQRNIQCNYVIETIHKSQRTNVFRNNSELLGLTATTQT